MRCSACTNQMESPIGIVGTVIKNSRRSLTIELTSPEDRRNNVDGGKPFFFPFYLRRQGTEFHFCSIPCAVRFLSHD